MKLFAILFLVLFTTACGNKALLQALNKINSVPEGAAILSAISLNLKAKTPLNEIGDLLQTILNGYLTDSQDYNQRSQANIDRLNAAVTDQQALGDTLQNILASLETDLDAAKQTVADDQDKLVRLRASLANEQQALSDRDAAAAVDLPAFDEKISQLSDAITAINNAVAKMRAFEQANERASSFIQIGSGVRDNLRSVADKINGMKKKLTKHSNMFTPLVRELIDLSSTLSQSKSDQVIDILNQLLDILQEALTATQNEKSVYTQNYEQSQFIAEEGRGQLSGLIAQSEGNVLGLTDRIANGVEFLEANQDLASSNLESLASNQAELATAQKQQDVRKARYEHIIGLVRQTIDYFNQSFSSIDAFVSQDVVNNAE